MGIETMEEAQRKPPCFRGIVLADGWDPQGNIISVVLADQHENIFYIEKGPVADALTACVHAAVEIEGRLNETGTGRATITARRFRVLDR